MERVNIPLQEEFTEDAWTNYTTYAPETNEYLRTQRHIDLRTFTSDSKEDWTAPGIAGRQTALDEFAGLYIPIEAEYINASESVTPDHPIDLLNGFEPTDYLTFGIRVFPGNAVSEGESYIDITSDPEGKFINETFSIVLKKGFEANVPNFLPQRPTQPAIELASGEWQQTLEAILEFEAEIHKYRQWKILRSKLENQGINLERITGVRFRMQGASSLELESIGNVIIAGFRLVAKEWVQSTVDFDNWNGRLVKPVPPNANPEKGAALKQGTLWRSTPISGEADPMIVDGEFGVAFYTGSQEGADSFTFYMREETGIFQTQLDLDGTLQTELDGRPQPDLGESEYLPRTITELEGGTLEEMESQTLESLERRAVPNPNEHAWIYFQIRWGYQGSVVMANSNQSSPGYVFPLKLKNDTNYFFLTSVEGSIARTRVFLLNEDFSINQAPIFDSTSIEDDGTFRRTRGRIGWSALLDDPDSFVRSLRPRGVTFAEYKSVPYRSRTPVDGAQLFADFTPDIERWNKVLSQYPAMSKNAVVARDNSRTLSGESFRITNKGVANQGFETDPLECYDWEQTVISFSLWFAGPARARETITVTEKGLYPATNLYPEVAKEYEETQEQPVDELIAAGEYRQRLIAKLQFRPGVGLIAPAERTFISGLFPYKARTFEEEVLLNSIVMQLVSTEGTVIPVILPEIRPNQWQKMVITIPTAEIIQTGKWSVRILQDTDLATTWWLDDFSVKQRAVDWSARSVASDPWNTNYAPWIDFGDIVNDELSGIQLTPRGKELQLRGRARQQNASIKRPKLVPHYAALGRLVWPEEAVKVATTGQADYIVPPTAGFTTVKKDSKTLIFNDASSAGSGAIVAREWLFGDGTRVTGNSRSVTHEYVKPAGESEDSYHATLFVTDRYGISSTVTQEVVAT